jgi:predicted nucleotidyltransferase
MDLLKKYLETLDKIFSYDFVLSVLIYGSNAKNRVKPLSDLDICIVLKENVTEKQKDEILSYSGKNLDVTLFFDLPITVQKNIVSTCKIYKTKINLSNLFAKTRIRWLDFKPHLNKLYKSRGYPLAV